jgi:hypothetical protein
MLSINTIAAGSLSTVMPRVFLVFMTQYEFYLDFFFLFEKWAILSKYNNNKTLNHAALCLNF